MNKSKLSDVVSIARQFQKSIHLDADFGDVESLKGYICQGSAKFVLDTMARHMLETKQRAFTWTGPYGGGKSSLALGLCSLVHPKTKVRDAAICALGLEREDAILRAFNPGRNGWLVLTVVGKRNSVVQSIYEALQKAIGKNDIESQTKITPDYLLKLLTDEANSKSHSGVLVAIDELGKFLESAVQNKEDVYFYQQLAELANRTSGKLVLVGILHQSFEHYATKLGREAREEWSKIQGRFVDIPLVSATDELVELTGKAINSDFKHPASMHLSKKIADLIRLRRPGVNGNFWLSLDNCWPLHPVTAALLGPTSKRRFGQNERSAFSFLVSVENKGFKDFLYTNDANEANYYLPSMFWDYLKINLEPAILASPDGHKWAQAAEAVERSEAKGETIHVELTKTIAVIELFKNGSGLSGDDETLIICLPNYSIDKIQAALKDLQQWSIIAYRKHLSAWGVFAGSDFDIDGALYEALVSIADPDLNILSKLTNLYPTVAKRHYFTTGTLRWMNIELCYASKIKQKLSEFQPLNGAYGAFLLSIPNKETIISELDVLCKSASKLMKTYPIAIGAPKNGEIIRELSRELLGMEYVRKNRPEHEGDPIARREIDGRISAIRSQLENEFRDAFINANWYLKGEKLINPGIAGLSPLASEMADKLFCDTPNLFSELLNRDKLSSTISKARRNLLHAMLLNESLENLGFDGYPAEAGLYHSILKSAGLHKKDESGNFGFSAPFGSSNSMSLEKAWIKAENLVIKSKESVELSKLYQLWSLPPFGIKQGVLPVLAFAFILANKDRIALYRDGMFIPEITDTIIDEALQNASRIAMKYVEIDKKRQSILEGINIQLREKLGISAATDPLDAARTLVAIMFNQSAWAQRTNSLTVKSRQVRDTLLRASDPHKVLFIDLPIIFGTDISESYISSLGDALKEITTAYDKMLNRLISKMMQALDAKLDDISIIRERAKTVSGITGDFRLDGFAARLSVFEQSRDFYEGLLGLAVNKPSRDWNDQDVDLALITLADWALKFRQIEAIASVRDRAPTRKAIAVVFGTGDAGKTISNSFDISIQDQSVVDKLAETLVGYSSNVSPEIFLAALAQVGANILELKGNVDE